MDPLVGAGVGTGINVLGGIGGELYAAEDERRATQARRKALAEILGLNPDDLNVDPASVGPSQFAGIQEDPQGRAAQSNALRRMQDVINSGGMDAQSMDAYGQAQSAVDQQARGAREAERSSAARRGISGSGLEMARNMENQQAAATRLNAAGMSTAADARSRALQAMQAASSMGSQLRGDDYRKAADAAQASDAIAKFNATNSMDAQQFNSGMQQDVAKDKYGALNDSANSYAAQAQRKRKMVGGVAQSAAGVFGPPSLGGK